MITKRRRLPRILGIVQKVEPCPDAGLVSLDVFNSGDRQRHSHIGAEIVLPVADRRVVLVITFEEARIILREHDMVFQLARIHRHRCRIKRSGPAVILASAFMHKLQRIGIL